MNNEKYYKPTIEEFCVGFEFEEYFRTSFKNKLIKSQEELYFIINPVNLSLHSSRVKFLDQEDIESLEFKKRLNNQWVGWNDYILETISGNYGYFLTCTLHVPRMGDLYKIYVHRHLDGEKNDIENQLKNGESELIFKGKIKNKSILKNTLKQLGII